MALAARLVERFDRVDASTPGAARRAVQAFAREHIDDAETLDAISLCVTEAVTNIVVHAYRDRPELGCATVEATFEDSALRVLVCDRGMGMAPRIDSPGLGLGVPLIAGLCDSSHICARHNGGTEICMSFVAQAPEAALDAAA